MSTSIGRAALVLTTDAAQARAGLGEFKSNATKLAEETAASVRSRLSGILSGIGRGFVAGVGLKALDWVTGAVGSVAGLRQEIDGAAKASRRLGVDTATWQGIAHAANLSGVSVEALEGGLRRFRTQASGPLDEALVQMARRLEGVSDEQERATILTEAFGKSGLEFATLFEAGPDALREMIGEVSKYGAALSDVDAARVEAANDAWTRAELALKGVGQQLLVAAAPALEAVGKIAARVATAISGVVSTLTDLLDRVGRWLGISADRQAQAVTRVRQAVREVREEVAVAAADTSALTARLREVSNPALLRGTSAEVSARLRFQAQGGPAPSKELLAEQRRANKHLQQIESGVRQLNRKPAGPQLATL